MSLQLRTIVSGIFLPFWFCLHPIFRALRGASPPWVIGGHRGRIISDNSRLIALEALRQGVDVVWLGNETAIKEADELGLKSLSRQTWRARIAISQAPCLVYSHGEDDLDLFLIFFRKILKNRFLLGHCLHLIKAAGVMEPRWQKASAWLKCWLNWQRVDCDFMLAVSEAERECLARSYPEHKDHILLTGGAHLDLWGEMSHGAKLRTIYYFPTWRETKAEQSRLIKMVEQLNHSQRLKGWLNEQGLELVIGMHINAAPAQSKVQLPLRLSSPQHLLEEVDSALLVISDYSGVIFDCLAAKKPLLLFPYDLAEYTANRGLFRDYSEFSFAPHAHHFDELIDLITSEAALTERFRQLAEDERHKMFPPLRSSASSSIPSRAQVGIKSMLDKLS